MKTLIFALLLFAGCSELTENPVKTQTDGISEPLYRIHVINQNTHFSGDSVQVSNNILVLFRNGEAYLSYPLEVNPVISVR